MRRSIFLSHCSHYCSFRSYANAYGTDLPVPVQTAAFLHDQSTYPHHFSVEQTTNGNGDQDTVVVDDDSGLIIATLHTPPNHQPCLDQEHEDELVQMSTALDSLGWTKRFVDIRQQVPRIAIPRRFSNSLKQGVSMLSASISSENMSSLEDSGRSSSGEASKHDEAEKQEETAVSLHELKQKKIVESRDVSKVMKSDANDPYHRLQLPVGHNMMVAFSRSRVSTYMNKGGRPVIDALAKELVEGIFSWKEDDDKKRN